MSVKRLFVAVNLPSSLKEALFQKYCGLLSAESFKLVEKENLHLTLKFLGNLPVEKIPELCRTLSAISSEKKLTASLEGFGSFGKNILWIGISKGSEEMQGLSNKINNSLGTEFEEFSPHLTIARNKHASNLEFHKVLEALQKIKVSESFEVKSVDLMESALGEKGPKYSVIRSFELS